MCTREHTQYAHTLADYTITSIEYPDASKYPFMCALMLIESHLINDTDGFAVVRAPSWPL